MEKKIKEFGGKLMQHSEHMISGKQIIIIMQESSDY